MKLRWSQEESECLVYRKSHTNKERKEEYVHGFAFVCVIFSISKTQIQKQTG